jgi:hypothetical protein
MAAGIFSLATGEQQRSAFFHWPGSKTIYNQ